MSPELLRDDELGPPADVYALGVSARATILYEQRLPCGHAGRAPGGCGTATHEPPHLSSTPVLRQVLLWELMAGRRAWRGMG